MKVGMREISEAFLKNKPVKNKQIVSKMPENMDKVTICAQDTKTDIKFVDSLKAQILNEIKAGTSADKLNDLKKQVQSGDYDINPADIVRKMMLS